MKLFNPLLKFGLTWKLLLIPLVIGGMSLSFMYPNPTEPIPTPTSTTISIDKSEGSPMIWVSEWLSSGQSGYGKGNFFYRLSRSQYAIDKSGNYQYEIFFISDSYYAAQNYNGATPYRCATKIDNVTLFVNGKPFLNNMTGSSNFWILFQGNYDSGIGERRVSLVYPSPNAQVYIQWSQPYPY